MTIQTVSCSCSDRQLEQVGCECAAEVNVATTEINRRWDAAEARAKEAEAEAEAEYYRREQAALDAEAAYHLAQMEAAEAEGNRPAFDWDGYNNRCIEQFGLFPA